MGYRNKPVRINLALQGGGAHGAFTWGVLDRLLEDTRIQIADISGTSAGAINAVVMISGFLTGGRAGARRNLRELWTGVQKNGLSDLLRYNPVLHSLSKSSAVAQMASLISPYEFNPMGYDPLRDLLARLVSFETIRARSHVKLFVAATNIATGRPKLFREHELTIEKVLASACLPTVHHTVEIDNSAYWDGGYTANPDLVTLAETSANGDTLIVQLMPRFNPKIPKGAREIAFHMADITFGTPLQRDVELIMKSRELVQKRWFGSLRKDKLARHRFHLVEAGRYTSALEPESKAQPNGVVIDHLFEAGRTEAGKWIDKHLPDIGRRESVDLASVYLRPEANVKDERDDDLKANNDQARAGEESRILANNVS